MLPKEPEDHYAWAQKYIFTSEELRGAGVNLNHYPGAVFQLAKDDWHLLRVSVPGITEFQLTPEILDDLAAGNFKRVFFPEGLRRIRPELEALANSEDTDMVVASILEFSALSHPSYMHIFLRLMPDRQSIFGLAQHIPPSVWPSNVIKTRARQFRLKRMDRFRSLTTREREVLRSMVEGLTNGEIAEELDISVNTVKTHKKNVHVKLDIAHPGDLMRYAVAFDLVEFEI